MPAPKDATLSVEIGAQPISSRRIADLFISAIEGGCNYWARHASFMLDDRRLRMTEIDDDPDLVVQATITITDEDGDSHVIRREEIRKGLELMRTTRPRDWADFTTENDDADTADTFVQLCCFGELVYG